MGLIWIAVFCGGIAVGAIFWRLIFQVIKYLLWLTFVITAARMTLLADDRLRDPTWYTGLVAGGVIGFIVVGILMAGIIYNMLVEADKRRAIAKAIKDHDARKFGL